MAELSLVIPCTLNYLYPEIAEKAVMSFQRLGYTLLISEKQGCCGYPYVIHGEKNQSKGLAQKFLFDFQTGRRNHKIVPLSSNCHHAITENYPMLFHNSVSHNLCSKVLADVANMFDIIAAHNIVIEPKEKTVLVVDCVCDFDKLQSILAFDKAGSNWLIKSSGYSCCGGNGLMSKSVENQADEYFLDYVEFANKNNVDTFVFTSEFCMMHAHQVLESQNLNFKTLHFFELLYEHIFSQSDF